MNGQSDKGFLLISKVYPQGVVCPCPGAIYMYKNIKNVYKTRFRRDHFQTCNIWAKRKGLSSKFCPYVLTAPAQGYKHVENMEKRVETVLKLATNVQSDKGFLLTSTSAPALRYIHV